MINEVHYNYLITEKNNSTFTLLNEDNIKQIFNAFEPLCTFITNKKSKVSAIQIAEKNM